MRLLSGFASLLVVFVLVAAPTARGAEVHHVQSIADFTSQSSAPGDFLSLAYTVPVDGFLVVSTGSTGQRVEPESVIFRKQGGQIETLSTPEYTVASVTQPASASQQWSRAVGNQLYYLPVQANDAGTIEVTYAGGQWATVRRGIVASTVSGVSALENVRTFAVGDTSSITGTLDVGDDAIVMTSLMSDGPTTLGVTGPGHVFDATPMQQFQSTRLAAGHALPGAGSHTLGYVNTERDFQGAVLILAAFSDTVRAPIPPPPPIFLGEEGPTEPATELWDLSPYSSEISTYLGTHTWPTLPDTRTTQTLSRNDCAQLADWANDGGVHVTVTVAQTGCGSIQPADDTFIEFRSGTGTAGARWLHADSSDRVRISGGTHTGSSPFNIRGNDLIIDDGEWSVTSGVRFYLYPTDNPARIAFVGNSITGGSYAFFALYSSNGSNTVSDVTIAGNYVIGGTVADEATLRSHNGLRYLVVANDMHQGAAGSKQCVRFYGWNNDHLVMNNNCHDAGTSWWAIGDNDSQLGNLSDIGFIENRTFNDSNPFAQIDQQNGRYTCTNADAIGNDKLTAAGTNPVFAGRGCSGNISGNNGIDIDDPPYNGNAPTCSTDYGRTPLGCGDVEYVPPF